MVVEITKSNFKEEVLDCKVPVLIDFWASWCGPCRSQSPIIDEFDKLMAGDYKVGKLNVDAEEELAAQFGVMSIPTLLVFNNGKLINKAVGLQSLNNLKLLVQ